MNTLISVTDQDSFNKIIASEFDHEVIDEGQFLLKVNESDLYDIAELTGESVEHLVN